MSATAASPPSASIVSTISWRTVEISVDSAAWSSMSPGCLRGCAIGWVACVEICIYYSTYRAACHAPVRNERGATMLRGLLVFLISCSVAAAAPAEDAGSVLARAKAASGGDLWNTARSWRGDGTLAAGGLDGEYHAIVDLTT